MIRRFRRSRRALPRRKRPAYRRRRLAIRRMPAKMGYFRLVRRAPENAWRNSGTLGVLSTTGSVAQAGTPVAGSFSGYYDIPGVAVFTLADILNVSDITNLFDKYKLAWVKLNIYCTSTTATAGGTAQLPSIIYSVDEDDGTFPTTALLREKMGTKQRMFYPGRPVSIFIKPKVARALNLASSLTLSGSEVSRAPYINCSYSTVPHFGLKFALLDANLSTTASTNTQFKFDFTYCIKARDAQ